MQYLLNIQVKMEDAPRLLKIQKSECPDVWIRLPRHECPKSWANVGCPVVPLERYFSGHPSAGLLWERQFQEVLLELGWEKVPNWECLSVHRKQGLFLSVFVDDVKKLLERSRIWLPWKKMIKHVNTDEPTSFLDHENLGCTQRECKPNESIVEQYKKMF